MEIFVGDRDNAGLRRRRVVQCIRSIIVANIQISIDSSEASKSNNEHAN